MRLQPDFSLGVYVNIANSPLRLLALRYSVQRTIRSIVMWLSWWWIVTGVMCGRSMSLHGQHHPVRYDCHSDQVYDIKCDGAQLCHYCMRCLTLFETNLQNEVRKHFENLEYQIYGGVFKLHQTEAPRQVRRYDHTVLIVPIVRPRFQRNRVHRQSISLFN